MRSQSSMSQGSKMAAKLVKRRCQLLWSPPIAIFEPDAST